MDTKTPKKRQGRPKRQPTPGERVALGLRVTPEIKQRLDDAAEQSGRSQSQEAELRLERSFERQDVAVEMLEATYGRQLAGLLMLLGRTMKEVGLFARVAAIRDVAVRGEGWLETPAAFNQAAEAVETIIEAFRPAGDTSLPEFKDDELNAIFATLGEKFAAGNLSSIANPEQAPTLELREWGGKVHDMLGPLASAMKSRLKPTDIAVATTFTSSKEIKS